MEDISPQAIAETAARIAPFVRVTPTVQAKVPGVGRPVTFKLEYLQHSGSFKARGAFASLSGGPLPPAGVAAASGGNHGAAIALAARHFGVPAQIFVPGTAPQSKIDRIESCGAKVVRGGSVYQDVLEAALDHCRQTGALNVHAYDQPSVLLGQGTLGREIDGQCPGLDTLLVATGGGGLIGGIAAWFQGRVNVVSAEPVESATLHTALKAGKPVPISPGGIARDSLGASLAGSIMLPIARRFIKHAVLVEDDAIRAAMKWLWSELRIAVEPGGATALAALMTGAYRPVADENLAVLLCGANIDPRRFAELVGD